MSDRWWLLWANGMLWISPMYNGSVSGSFKNAIDWLAQRLQVVNTMEFSVRSLRGWEVPYVVPVPQAGPRSRGAAPPGRA